MLRTLGSFVLAAGLACAATPAATPTRLIPPGVSVGGIRVGGLSAEPARARIEAAFARPIRIVFNAKTLRIGPAQVGTSAGIDAGVGSALSATPRSRIAVPVTYSTEKIDKLVARLGHLYDRAAVDATVTGATAAGPVFATAKLGRAVDRKTMRAALVEVIRDGTRTPLELMTKPVSPHRTVVNFGPAIVITRGANTLKLYDGRHLVRTFRVATGQTVYPTPAGVWHIVDLQRNPWWRPPSSPWARGLQPIPPGPNNPLGTRWMGLDAAGVGIHGTNAPSSIGYSVSHGCIRMEVPDAEWLFEHVRLGVPVVIL
ncbi:MAG: L,D-transpeptidase family protein [Gaiellaceae bacterium]